MRLLVPLCLLLVACGPKPDLPSAGVMEERLRAVVKRGPGGEVGLRDIAPGAWTHVYVFGPYTPTGAIAACLKTSSASSLSEGIESRDDIHLLVFAYPDGELASVALGRGSIDFAPRAVGGGYGPAAARFIVRSPPAGSWGELVPALEPDVVCIPAAADP